MADEVDVTDVDAELERRGGDHNRYLPGLQPLLGLEARVTREAAVVRSHPPFTEALRQVMRDPLGQPARVHEHQRGAVLADQFDQPVVGLGPLLVRRDRAQGLARDPDGELPRPPVTDVDDGAVGCAAVRDPIRSDE